MNTITDLWVHDYVNQKKSFALYRSPNEKNFFMIEFVSAIPFQFSFLNKTHLNEGFVVFPFDEKDTKGWWFNITETTEFEMEALNKTPYENINNPPEFSQTDFDKYKHQFDEMQKEITSGKLKKVTLSRVINRSGDLRNYLFRIFSQLCINNPAAFIYLLSTPETGIWVGASPELLLKKEYDFYSLVSLAGTKRQNDTNISEWGIKELEEQGIVTDFIDNQLQRYEITGYEKTGPSVIKANSVTHLKTDYQFNTNILSGRLGDFIRDIHPTPAISGYPKQDAISAIHRIEQHKRKYYGGFIGAVTDNKINLYVNIRCANINTDHSLLFTGGGLTALSNVQDEWRETEMKAETLMKIFDSMD